MSTDYISSFWHHGMQRIKAKGQKTYFIGRNVIPAVEISMIIILSALKSFQVNSSMENVRLDFLGLFSYTEA